MNPTTAQTIPAQQDVDWTNPEEHFAWALRNMAPYAGSGMITHPGFLRKFSEHLVRTGAVHVDYLRTLADENGNIHVSQLPKQQIRFQEATRGPRHGYNNAARWVPVDAPDDAPVRIQDLSKATLLEQEIYAEQLRRLGVIGTPEIPQHRAQELNEGH